MRKGMMKVRNACSKVNGIIPPIQSALVGARCLLQFPFKDFIPGVQGGFDIKVFVHKTQERKVTDDLRNIRW